MSFFTFYEYDGYFISQKLSLANHSHHYYLPHSPHHGPECVAFEVNFLEKLTQYDAINIQATFSLNLCESVWKGLVGLELKGRVRANMHRPWPPCSSAVDLRTHTGDRDSGVCEDFGRQRHTEEGGQMYTQVTFQLHKKEVCCDEKQNSNTQLETDVRHKDIA